MNYNTQWPGHGQKEMPDIFHELVAATPQLPLEKIGNLAKLGLEKIRDTVKEALHDNEAMPQTKPKNSI